MCGFKDDGLERCLTSRFKINHNCSTGLGFDDCKITKLQDVIHVILLLRKLFSNHSNPSIEVCLLLCHFSV